jgi:hypothetical protein
MAFSENLAEFFSNDDFGVMASYTPKNGATITINGIFDAEYLAVDGDGSVGVSCNTPIFGCKTADVINPHLATLVVNSKSYKVMEHRPDGTGISTLVLQEV